MYISHDDITPFGPDEWHKLLEVQPMQEDKREKVRQPWFFDLSNAPSTGTPPPPFPIISDEAQQIERELELLRAKARAQLTVLKLTDKDKRFLRAMKIEAR